ncbi:MULTISPECIES: hypothetical protein [Paraburkholderia]|uniref:Uncharacterized protein n=1 Tax=Paraburkholderia unamae TaxID=219649 RepID=A0ACC6RT60_9BURK
MAREASLATPGEILHDEWLKPMAISQYALADVLARITPHARAAPA